jgi:excisionase family DNA binding protein
VDLESILASPGEGQKDGKPPWLVELSEQAAEIGKQLGYPERSVDQEFIAFLRLFGNFGFFTFGPITIDVGIVEDIFWRTEPRATNVPGLPQLSPALVANYVRFWEEFENSGRSRVEPVHMLLAYMRCPTGLTARVFGELGVQPEEVADYAARLAAGRPLEATRAAVAERLYSTEEVAAYFNVHVQTVRVWIRSGKLPAFRLAGQKAIRIRESDLKTVLEPIDPSEIHE